MFNIIRKVRIFSPKGIFSLIKAVLIIGINPYIIIYLAKQLYKDKIAFTFEGENYTYNQLYAETQLVAATLKTNYCLKKKQKIGIACSNHPMHIFILFAAAYLGLDIFLLNAEMSEEQRLKVKVKFNLDLVIDNLFSELFIPNKTSKTKPVKSNFNRIVVLTSGTTGDHKAAERKSSISAFISPFLSLIKQLRLVNYQSVYLAIPIYHGFGIITLCVSLLLGTRIFISAKFNAIQACKDIDDNKIEAITLVPLMLNRMLNYNFSALSSLRCIISGGAALDPQLVENIIEKLGNDKLFNIYGSSEAGISILATPKHLAYSSRTIGKPLKGVKIRIIDDKGRILKDNETGQLTIKCKWSVKQGEWIATGDMGYVDSDGYYFLMGRADDMIISGGENVYPSQLENILLTHPSIEEAIAIGIEDKEFGTRLKAFVVLSEKQDIREKNILEWLSFRAARYQMPKDITFISEVPLSGAGKPDKKALLNI